LCLDGSYAIYGALFRPMPIQEKASRMLSGKANPEDSIDENMEVIRS